jgi:hypothetical protein
LARQDSELGPKGIDEKQGNVVVVFLLYNILQVLIFDQKFIAEKASWDPANRVLKFGLAWQIKGPNYRIINNDV